MIMRTDVLIFGGGAAGLWCLDRFRRAGYQAVLVEAKALGAGQTIQSQGIIHGGGKYALHGIKDFAAVRTTSEMPERWRRCLAGMDQPSLLGAQVLSDRCFLWLPRGSLTARAQSWGLPLVARAGLLATRPIKVDKTDWPEALRGSALAAYAMAEQVISSRSFLEKLAALHENFIFLYNTEQIGFNKGVLEAPDAAIEARTIVLTAGIGNAELMQNLGIQNFNVMQRRPLGMVMLRGSLPPLFGHCVAGGKTQLTITTPTDGIWQVGGELAERLAHGENRACARKQAVSAIRRWLPGLDLSGTEIATYWAVRAEARTADLRRPSGVHASYVGPHIVAAWPTKLCLVPVLADEVYALVDQALRGPAGYPCEALPPWPKPTLARAPWEDAQWSSAA